MVKEFKLGEPARPKAKREVTPTAVNPVARVVLDTPVSHLAREFDYLVPETFDAAAQPGVRVKVKFGRQDLDGFITKRLAESDQQLSDLKPLRKVVSPEPVLKPEILQLAQGVADYYGGTIPDVLRFAIPARHARAESELPSPSAQEPDRCLETTERVSLETPWLNSWLHSWNQYQNSDRLLEAITSPFFPSFEEPPSAVSKARKTRYVWTPLPGLAAPKPPETIPSLPLWAAQIAALMALLQTNDNLPSGTNNKGVLIVAPDITDVIRIQTALQLAGIQKVVRLVAEDGIEARYKAFLQIERGMANVVIGTRSAVFAPIANLALMVLWGDGDPNLIEQHTPHFNAREVLKMRSDLSGVPLIVGAIGRTVAAQNWVENGTATNIVGYRDALRNRAPLVKVLDSAATAVEGYLPRVPTSAAQAARTALANGPVLVQVPLTGYLPRFDCLNCREPARCANCGGLLIMPDAGGVPSCRACGQLAPNWRCPNCGGVRIRAGQKGADRTAEEFGRAFPHTQIIVSTGNAPGGVKAALPRPTRPAIVIATPGAEPVMPGGYATALILDAGATPGLSGLDFAPAALARWLGVGHLVVPASAGGQLLLIGNANPHATAGLVRFDPVLFATRELAERLEAEMPPVVRFAEIIGDAAAVNAVVARIELATPLTLLGPVPVEPEPEPETAPAVRALNKGAPTTTRNNIAALFDEPRVRALIRVPASDGLELARQLRASLAVRSANREGGKLKAQLDPPEFS